MKNLGFVLLVASLTALSTLIQAQDAKEIIRRSNEKNRGKTSAGVMTMKIVRPKWTRTVSLKSWSKGDDYSLILIQAPAKDKGSSFLKRARELWNWQPKINRTIKLPPSMMTQSWMGSDFTNDDLVKQSSIVDDYTHKIIASEKIEDRDCYKIQLIPKPDAPVVWGKVLMWVSKKEYLQLKSEMYDEDGYLVNTMKSSKIKMIGGRLLPSQLEMIPADKKGQKTLLTYASMSFDQPISDSFFSTQNMKRVK